MKKIFNILMLAAVVALTSCNYEPEGWHGTIFDGNSDEVVFDRTSINYAFGPEEGTTIQIPVSRGIATEAYTTHIQILDAEGNPIMSNPDYALMAIEQAKFEVDQYEAVATLTFDRRQFVAGTAVNFILTMRDTQINSDVTMCALTILRDYTWSEYCGATNTSYYWGDYVPSVVYKAEGFPYYRVYEMWTDNLADTFVPVLEFQVVDGEFTWMSTPNSNGYHVYPCWDTYEGAEIVKMIPHHPNYFSYDAEANELYTCPMFYVPALGGGFGYIDEIWSFEKPL